MITTIVKDDFLAGIMSEERDMTPEKHIYRHGVKQRIFGQMIKLGSPLVRHYQGDFYHDVHWLDEWLKDFPAEFYFGADDCGTAIGTDYRLVRQARENVWKFSLYVKDHSFWLRIEKVEDE